MALNPGDVTLLAVTFIVAQIALHTLKIYGEPRLNRWINGRNAPTGHGYELGKEAREMLESTRDHTRRIDREVCGRGGCADNQGQMVLALNGISESLKDAAQTHQRIVELLIAHDAKTPQVRT